MSSPAPMSWKVSGRPCVRSINWSMHHELAGMHIWLERADRAGRHDRANAEAGHGPHVRLERHTMCCVLMASTMACEERNTSAPPGCQRRSVPPALRRASRLDIDRIVEQLVETRPAEDADSAPSSDGTIVEGGISTALPQSDELDDSSSTVTIRWTSCLGLLTSRTSRCPTSSR